MAGTALCIALSAATPFAAEDTLHVHVGDRSLTTLMERGMAGSGTFRSLVAQLDAAPIQVLVRCDSFMPEGLSGHLNLVTSVGSVRYVRVAIRCSLPVRKQLSMLAHELQHALEIAINPEIVDADSMESYYADVGFLTRIDNTHRSFETDAALEIERLVYQEMMK
jgi:hypothetical protein